MTRSNKKIIFLRLPEAPEWNSIKKILRNMQELYTEVFQDQMTVVETTDLKTIHDLDPDIIIIADNRLNFEHTVGAIKSVIAKPIDWVIHAYGCFSGRITEFLNAYQRMGNDRFKIIAASKMHQQVITNLFQDPSSVVHTPFPYRKIDAFFDEHVRRKSREVLGLEQNEIVLLYAGRISFQKNVHQLINLFNQYKASIPTKTFKLIICGEIDDLNPYTDEAGQQLGLARKLFLIEIERSGPDVKYLGQLDHADLVNLYHAVDGFVSLSTHFGEDYGFAVAEALGYGLPCFLSRWGGYKDFASLPQTQFVKPIYDERVFSFEFEDFRKLNFSKAASRTDNIKHFLDLFSDQALWNHYQNNLDYFSAKPRLSRLSYLLYQIDSSKTSFVQKKQLFESGLLFPFWKQTGIQ